MCIIIQTSRTGLLVMLCQSILGLDDEAIISDYHQSELLLNPPGSLGEIKSSAASMATKDRRGKLSREIFSGSPSKVMESTLGMIRQKYGSIDKYLDAIDFDSSWRERFLNAVDDNNIVRRGKVQELGNLSGQNQNQIQSKL